MEAASPAFRKYSIVAAVIVIKAGGFHHQRFHRLQFTGSHVTHNSNLLSLPHCRDLQGRYFSVWATKKRGCFYSVMEKETTPLSFTYSNDFSDGMYDTEQQPDEEGKSSDKTAYD